MRDIFTRARENILRYFGTILPVFAALIKTSRRVDRIELRLFITITRRTIGDVYPRNIISYFFIKIFRVINEISRIYAQKAV